jgi:chromate transporter
VKVDRSRKRFCSSGRSSAAANVTRTVRAPVIIAAATMADAHSRRERLFELAALFLKLGVVSVGGPAAHIALMHQEVVDRRRWLTSAEFLDLVGATNLIPGPNSTELAIHIGRLRAGWPGLLVAGACFILPAVVIVMLAAAFYVEAGTLPQAHALFYGVKPVVIAVVALALWQLLKTAVKTPWHACLAGASIVAIALGLEELAVLAIAGIAGAVAAAARRRTLTRLPVAWLSTTALAHVTLAAESPPTAVTMGTLFLVFLKAGGLLFGSGYVLLAFLHADLVQRLHWLTEQQLLDAVAIGQITPGPVFTTATFIGYLLAGKTGAVTATIAIFLPAFVYVAASAPLLPRLRASAIAGGVLDGVNMASLALMVAVTWLLGHAALVDVPTWTIAAVSLLVMLRWPVNAAWLLLAGALLGALMGGDTP